MNSCCNYNTREKGNQVEEKDIKKETAKILRNMGMRVEFKGYKYWQIAMDCVVKGFCEATKGDICVAVAKRCRKPISSVERCLRYSVDNVNAKDFFKTNQKVTVSSFLVFLIEKLEEEAGINVF